MDHLQNGVVVDQKVRKKQMLSQRKYQYLGEDEVAQSLHLKKKNPLKKAKKMKRMKKKTAVDPIK